MDWSERIQADPNILTGKPVIRGTRVSVEQVLEHISAGWTESQILAAHPFLKREDILACVAYALDVLRDWHLMPSASKRARTS
ncbi:MAG: DUF433 domain-containing protein [Planctomycetes bacterium]|nr:DUF433 domain-containing protein [Planctomycetota bacterium]